MSIGWIVINIIDIMLFVIVSLTVAYLAVFSIASLFNKRTGIPAAKHQNRFIILIPAYKQDKSIEQTVKTALGQTYPQRLFDITVISDHQKEITNFHLAQYPITLLTPNFASSTKAKSLQLAINNLPQFKIYDIAIVLDAGSVVEPEFLQQMNDAFESAGTKAIQAHRLSKNRDTAIANLDAIFEEINNSVFRRGHITLGISAAISGSGIAYDFKWFKENIMKINTGWEDKELEALLMRQHIYVDYFDHILVYDEKTRQSADFNKQRGRWASTQLRSLFSNVRYLPVSILRKRYDLTDKIIQWMLIPRTIMVAVMVLMSVVLPFIYLTLAVKWWVLFAVTMFVLALATPDYLVDDKWDKSFFKAPFIMLASLLNITKIIRRKKNFENRN